MDTAGGGKRQKSVCFKQLWATEYNPSDFNVRFLSPDFTDDTCSDNFISLWPKNDDIPMDVLTAIFNSPIANAYAYIVDTQHTHGNRRRLVLDWLKTIPIPPEVPWPSKKFQR